VHVLAQTGIDGLQRVERQPRARARVCTWDHRAQVLCEHVLCGPPKAAATRNSATDRVMCARRDRASGHDVVHQRAALCDNAVKVAPEVREVGTLEVARRHSAKCRAVIPDAHVGQRLNGH